jgi:hypothetical protein
MTPAKPAILLCGIPSEPPLRLVASAAAASGISYWLFNQREASRVELACWWEGGQAGGRLRQAEVEIELHHLSGVYLRLMDYQDLPEYRQAGPGPADRSVVQSHISGLHQTLQDWLEAAELRVMNRSSAMGSNLSKPYQSQIIARVGFAIPATLVTNDPLQARQFIETYERVIYKSISSQRSIVQQISAHRNPAGYQILEKIRSLPTQFQAFIPGENVRIHVVGERVFPTRVHSQAIDYRYASREGLDIAMEAVQLDVDISARCLELARLLNLPLCGIDLKLTPQGEWVCFEVNPSPAFSYYQEHSGQEIAQAIVAYLAEG